MNQAAGAYTVLVEARNGPTVLPRTATRVYTVVVPAPVASVLLAANAASPVTRPLAAAVRFTATPTGGVAPAKQYQFSRSADGGTTWTVVRAWSATATWDMARTTAVGNYQVKVDVRTNATAIDATATIPFVVQNPKATGVTLTSNPAVSPAVAPVSFLATGQGPAPLAVATGGGYFYRFSLSTPGGPFVPAPGLRHEPHLHVAG